MAFEWTVSGVVAAVVFSSGEDALLSVGGLEPVRVRSAPPRLSLEVWIDVSALGRVPARELGGRLSIQTNVRRPGGSVLFQAYAFAAPSPAATIIGTREVMASLELEVELRSGDLVALGDPYALRGCMVILRPAKESAPAARPSVRQPINLEAPLPMSRFTNLPKPEPHDD